MDDNAENNFKQTGNLIKTALATLTQWLKNLGEQLEIYGATAPQRELGKWLAKNGGSVYAIRGSCGDELKQALTDEGIAYISDVTNPNFIIVRQPDLQQIQELNREILVARCNYYQEVDGREMEDAIARVDKIQDKNIFTIHNLNEYETEVLKNKFNNISYGFMVGLTQGDKPDTKNVSVPGSKVFNFDIGKRDISRAYLEMAFSLYGMNSELKVKQIEADKAFDKAVAALKGQTRSYYIAGQDDIGQFLEINRNGFEYYTSVTDENGIRCENEVMKCDINDPDYDIELQIYLDKMKDKIIFKSSDELNEHLNTSKQNYRSSRPEKNKEERQISRAEDKLVVCMDKMIKTDVINSGRRFKSPDENFAYYQNEAGNIINAAIKGELCGNYSKEDMAEIINICNENNLEIGRYEKVRSALEGILCETHKAKELTKEKKREVQKEYGVSNR